MIDKHFDESANNTSIGGICMENTQKLMHFLNNFCKSCQSDRGCNDDCPNYYECRLSIWKGAVKELKEIGVEVLL